MGKCRSYGAQFAFAYVYPGFHIGLCPYSTLGYAGVSPLQGSLSYCLLFTQGFISGFALIPPWALQECRPCRAHCRIGRLRCCVVVLCSLYLSLGAFACVGKCRSYGAQSAFICVYPGFHIGLCPYSTLGYAGVSPLQGSLSYWAFAVLCRGIVFVKCVWVCKWIVACVRSCICLILIVWVVVRDCLGGVIGAVGQ